MDEPTEFGQFALNDLKVAPFRTRSAWIVALATTLGMANWGAIPWVVGALVDSGRLPSDLAGLIGMIELTAMGLMLLAITPVIAKIPSPVLLSVGLSLAIAAQLGSLVAVGFPTLAVARIVSGAAFGLLLAVAGREGARSSAPVGAFALGGIVSLIFGAAKEVMLGSAKQEFGLGGVFGCMIIYYIAVGLPLLFLGTHAVRGDIAPSKNLTLSTRVWLPLLVAMAMFSLATGGVFAFIQQIAVRVGLDGMRLASGLALITFVGTIGAVMADRVGRMRNRTWPTAGGLFAIGIACMFVMRAPNAFGYWSAMVFWVIGYWYCYPLLLGLAAGLDSAGRLATAMSAVYILSAAAGTGLAGFMTRHVSAESFGTIALAACCFAALLAFSVMMRQPSMSND